MRDLRDIFPSRPTNRSAIRYHVDRLMPLPSANPRWRWLRVRRAHVRRWWRRHWWPARIRDLEAELRHRDADLWGE